MGANVDPPPRKPGEDDWIPAWVPVVLLEGSPAIKITDFTVKLRRGPRPLTQESESGEPQDTVRY